MSQPLLQAVEYKHETPGRTRCALVTEDLQPFRLYLNYHSCTGALAQLGDIYMARVTAKEPGGNGFFVDLGRGPHGLLRTRSAVHEGALLAVRVVSEARAEKGPVVSLESLSATVARPDEAGLISHAVNNPFHAGVTVVDHIENADSITIVEEAVDAALAKVWPLGGGGTISVERTRALVAIDVDAGGRLSRGDRDSFALEVNLIAAEAAARAISLKSLGGIVAMDLLKMKKVEDARQVEQVFAASLQKYLGRKSDVGRITRHGLLISSIQHDREPLEDVISRISLVERCALDVLHSILEEGQMDRGARLTASVSGPVSEWLDQTDIDWRGQLEEKIGPRFNISVEIHMSPGDEIVRSM